VPKVEKQQSGEKRSDNEQYGKGTGETVVFRLLTEGSAECGLKPTHRSN